MAGGEDIMPDREDLQRIAHLMGISYEEAARLLDQAYADQAIVALEAIDAPDAPAWLRGVALIANEHFERGDVAIRAQITAIQRDHWASRAGSHEGWIFRVIGNPIALESYLKRHRFPRAFACAPTVCRVYCECHSQS